MAEFKATVQQQAFIDELVNSTSHLALVARAGCGKTSTIMMGVDALVKSDPNCEIVVCAFNKAIADEVKDKLAEAGYDWRQVQAATLHSLGFGLFRKLYNPKVDANKVRKIIDRIADSINHEETKRLWQQYGAQIAQLVSMAKQAGFGFFSDLPIEDSASWHALADHYDINGLDDTSQAEQVVEAAQRVYRESLNETKIIDFDDMILFPLIKNLRVRFTKSHIFLDEAQDLNRARQALAKKFLTPETGRMCVVGDERQAIYGFAGADAAALANLQESLDAKLMPLSVSWRCPKAVIELAQTIVPDIEAAPNAKEGSVTSIMQERTIEVDGKKTDLPWFLDREVLPQELTKDDAILCRNTAPLITLAYTLIRNGVPCKVEGRQIGEGLKNLACRWKITTIDLLLDRLEAYKDREQQKAMAKGNEAKVEQVADRVDTLVEICNACLTNGANTIKDVVAYIDDLFADGATDVTVLATYHRAKGREWPRVILFEHHTRCPSKMAKQQWQKDQEDNLAYVAFTRSQDQLVFLG